MRKIIGIFVLGLVACIGSSPVLAAELKIAVVNVTELYNKSTFVQNANKTLQAHVKNLEDKLQAEKSKLQVMINNLEKVNSNKKNALVKEITSRQSELASLTQKYQQQIQEEQNAGLQKFTTLVQAAVAKVAKEKQYNSVLNSTSVVYTDNSWVDITNDVQLVMQQN